MHENKHAKLRISLLSLQGFKLILLSSSPFPTPTRKHVCSLTCVLCSLLQEYQIVKKSTRSLSTVQVESPWRLAQPSIISNIVLMKGHGRVSGHSGTTDATPTEQTRRVPQDQGHKSYKEPGVVTYGWCVKTMFHALRFFIKCWSLESSCYKGSFFWKKNKERERDARSNLNNEDWTIIQIVFQFS